MKHIIIGTAGHVDHGKTLLVKALTGIDTDRLQEEKKRGITIELGFAHVEFDDGTQAGIVDVPGHEKFIKNMLAGAGGIDLAMLVVAADEGFMPQTVEHLGILSLLGIRDGLVVITKCDMAESEWVEMIREDVAQQVKGTFLEGKPVLAVSAYTGEGIPELKEHLHQLVMKASEKSMRVPFRLPVDRVFSVEGFGTVVTGTLIEGCIQEGETAELVPSGLTAKVRNLQVHGKDVETAYAGQRVAINLAGLKKTEVARGDTVAKPGTVRSSLMIDVRLQNLRNSQRVILNDSQVHLYHGSTEQLCKVVLLDRDKLEPGESCYAQLRMTQSVSTKAGDRFVIRFFSPLETIGGGVVLDDTPVRHKRNRPEVMEALAIRESGSGGERLVQAVAGFGYALPDRKKIADKLSCNPEDMEADLQELVGRGEVMEALPGRYLAASVLDTVWGSCRALLEGYHKANPLHAGMRQAEVRQKLFKSTEQTVADAVLGALRSEGKIKKVADRYALSEFDIHYTKRQTAIRERLLKAYKDAGVETATVDEVMAMFAPNEKNDSKQVLDSVLSDGELVMLSPQICWSRETYERVCGVVGKHFEDHETITLAELRDALGTSRKYALAVLEYFDRNKVTKKEGDFRRLAQGFGRDLPN
ncbi:selenocysteine-specific translation elongation factor [Oscillibacter sp. MSJ-2]|uniref:Selenocysteine-specific elongation factor n=1 Tax=Dysosmobacter acutus TaxID=2841504 RepID=A0ABS6F7T0_9FIRM|nr:selenocysteine-specific translation elongation factor [Dysosmobacter acutus]MBU5626217.1 selenocysteine-specific translation elongation factor [Dysosmobacter acutus]